MITLALQSAIVVFLILLNGLFSMSETALVSSRKAVLRQRAESGDGGALYALDLAEPPVSEREVEVLLEEGARAGVFEAEERDLARRALRLDDRPVRTLMTPRPAMVWLDAEDPTEEHRRLVAESRHSYYPVARGDLDDLLGVAPVKDALAREIRTGEPADLLGSLRPPRLLSEGAPATEAVAAFKGSDLPLVLVVDERGNIEGLVTPTDVLEALVGDLEGPLEAPVVRRADGSLLVEGLLSAEELAERLGLHALPEEQERDYQTVGGMVMAHLGRVPAAGDSFEWEDFCFEVLDMDGNRVDKVLVARARQEHT
jgi:putative hemolysin